MKKILMAALLCCTIITTSAQEVAPDRNRTYNIMLNNVQYTHRNEKMSAGDAVGAVLTLKDIKEAIDEGQTLVVMSLD